MDEIEKEIYVSLEAQIDREVRRRIKVAPKLNPEKVKKEIIRNLKFGLDDAYGYNEQVGSITDPGISFKEFFNKMERIQKALIKLTNGKGTPEAAHKTIQSALRYVPANYLSLIGSYGEAGLSFKDLITQNPGRLEAKKLLDSVNNFLEDRNRPGKGGVGKNAQRQTMALQKLAQWFFEEIGAKANKHEASPFYEYVAIYAKYYLSDSDPLKTKGNLERDIKNSKNLTWKKII